MRFRRTTYFMFFCGALLAGLAASALTDTLLHPAWVVIAIVFILISLHTRSLGLLASLIFMGLIIGWLRGGQFMQRMLPYDDLDGQKVVIRIRADGDAIYDERRQLAFDGDEVRILEPYALGLPGRVKVSGFGVPSVQRGDIIQAEGKLFKTRGSRQASINFAELSMIQENGSGLEGTRRQFVAGAANALPEPHASFSLGLLIGQRNNLPEHVTEQLNTVGLTHIIAVSGYNLTIIIGLMRRLMEKRSKYQTMLAAGFLMAAFLFFTGFSASIVRATMVSSLGLLAWYYGRSFRPVLLLLLTAAVTATWYPPYLWSDIGWHLSFLAFYGVLVLAPLIAKRFFRKRPKLLGGVVLESVCAQLMTWPLILFIFAESSTVALLANVIVVPLVPLAMILSLVAGVGGMLFPVIASWFGLPARILLTYILDIVQLISTIPNARLTAGISLSGMTLLYATLLLASLVLWHRTRPQHGTITDTETV